MTFSFVAHIKAPSLPFNRRRLSFLFYYTSKLDISFYFRDAMDERATTDPNTVLCVKLKEKRETRGGEEVKNERKEAKSAELPSFHSSLFYCQIRCDAFHNQPLE